MLKFLSVRKYLICFYTEFSAVFKKAVFWYIEVYYKNYRLDESNGYRTPKDFLESAA